MLAKTSRLGKRVIYRLLSLACIMTIFGASSYAADYEWNLTGSGGVGTWGNVLTFTTGGVTVKASAWAYTYDRDGGTNNALQKAALGQWGTGLGVCDNEELGGHTSLSYCLSPDHQVDNMGPDEFVLFLFSTPVDPYYVKIDPYGTWDRDVEYRVGNVSPLVDLTGKNYTDLATLGFSSWITQSYSASDSPLDVPIAGTNLVNALLFGAVRGEFSGTNRDAFKITEISAGTTRVPEPSSLLLMATGLAGLLYARRRSKQ